MSHLETIPVWLAVLIAFFVVLGSTLVLLGALGFARLASFYDRLHAPTLGTSWGTAGIIIASMLMASYLEGRAVIHELVIGIFVMLTVPVTLILLGRAALHRDRTENSPLLPEHVLTAHRKKVQAEAEAAAEAEARAEAEPKPEQKLPVEDAAEDSEGKNETGAPS